MHLLAHGLIKPEVLALAIGAGDVRLLRSEVLIAPTVHRPKTIAPLS